jgi:AraC-like DNA-binding protein
MPNVKKENGWFILSTEDQLPEQRLKYWRDTICDYFFQAECASTLNTDFSGKISATHHGEIALVRIEADFSTLRRDKSHIARQSEAAYLLLSCERGALDIQQNGQDLTLRPGDMVLMDLTEPSSGGNIDATAGSLVRLPAQTVEMMLGSGHGGVGKVMTSDRPFCRIAHDLIAMTTTLGPSLNPAKLDVLVPSILDMVAVSLAVMQGAEPSQPAYRGALTARVKGFIKLHLHDPLLSTDMIAAAFRLTPRQIQRIFALQGQTVGQYIREQRLALCKRKLDDPALRNLSIADIARSVGFVSQAHFSRVFTEQYGVSPSQHRRARQSN